MTTDKGNPLEECCPVCERIGQIKKIEKVMLFKTEKWLKVPYTAYRCEHCLFEYITTEKECDPFQKAKDLGWMKG
jgi:hypothetical protein